MRHTRSTTHLFSFVRKAAGLLVRSVHFLGMDIVNCYGLGLEGSVGHEEVDNGQGLFRFSLSRSSSCSKGNVWLFQFSLAAFIFI